MSEFIAKELQGQSFSSKEEMFKALKENAERIINIKKSNFVDSDAINMVNISKSNAIKALDMEEGFIYPVINTTKYMDSHNDVHINGLWSKSVKEQQGKVYYVKDHIISIDNVIAWPEDVEMLTEIVSWEELGASYSGNTEALIFKIAMKAVQDEKARKAIEKDKPVEHSVRMIYVTVFLCINSTDLDFKEYLANWETYFPLVVNKDEVEEQGYFWAVTEAKIFREGSMVPAGSNPITPMKRPKSDITQEPPKGTQQKTEPEESTHETKVSNIVKHLNLVKDD